MFNILSKVHNLNYLDFYKTPDEAATASAKPDDAISNNRSFVRAIDRKSAFINNIHEPVFKSFFRDTVTVNEFGIRYISKGKMGRNNRADLTKGVRDIKNTIVNKKEIKSIKNIVYLKPEFINCIYTAGDVEFKPLLSEKNSYYFETCLESKFKEKNFNMVKFGASVFRAGEADKYNDACVINRIFEETGEHYNAASTNIINIKGESLSAKYETPYFLRACVYEVIFDNVKINVNGIVFKKDIKMFEYLFEIVNVKTGYIVYHRSYDSYGRIDESVMRNGINLDLKNLMALQNN